MRRFAPWLFIGAFFLATLLPALQMLTRWLPEVAIDEQRRLAPPPSTSASAGQFARDANLWFSDHFGFRALLISLKAEIDYRLFRVSDKVHVGRDGYLFYRSVLDVEKPALEGYLASHEAEVLDGFRRYAEALKRKNIQMVLVINLLGDRFLPEMLPAEVAKRPPLRRIDDFIDKARKIPHVTFVDSTRILHETEQLRPIFHRTDFHWNDPAAFPVAKAAVDAMSRQSRLAESPWKHPLAIEARQMSGGVARFMPLLHPPSEKTIFVKQTWAWPEGFAVQAPAAPFEEITTTRENPADARLLAPAVFVGDSFADALMRSGMGCCFQKTARARWKPDLRLSTITAALPKDTRWMVFQFIEVNTVAMGAFADAGDVTRAIDILEARAPTP